MKLCCPVFSEPIRADLLELGDGPMKRVKLPARNYGNLLWFARASRT